MTFGPFDLDLSRPIRARRAVWEDNVSSSNLCGPIILAGVLSSIVLAPACAGGFDCSRFKKNSDGTWSAVQPLEIGGPTGRIDFMPGETYKAGELRKGLDIVKLLDANCAN